MRLLEQILPGDLGIGGSPTRLASLPPAQLRVYIPRQPFELAVGERREDGPIRRLLRLLRLMLLLLL